MSKPEVAIDRTGFEPGSCYFRFGYGFNFTNQTEPILVTFLIMPVYNLYLLFCDWARRLVPVWVEDNFIVWWTR